MRKIWKPYVYRFGKRQAPTNGEDPLKKILEIMDAGSTSIKKHETINHRTIKLQNHKPITPQNHKTIQPDSDTTIKP